MGHVRQLRVYLRPGRACLSETDLGGATDKYTYDSLYRLTGESISDPDPAVGSRSYGYAYDLVGNRVSETDTTSSGTVTQNSIFNADGELTSVTNTSTGDVQNYHYDADGNTTGVEDGDGTVLSTYTWSPSGQMTGAVTGGNTVSYTYDAAGNRTSETVNDHTTTFLNDPNQAYDQVLEEYAENGVLAATYIRGIDLLFEDQSGVLSYYVSDNLGSTRALTNSAGAVTETYSYDAYGNLIANTGTTANPYRYTGQWFDAAIGQYYLRARDYNPLNGNFTSRDSYNGLTVEPVTENHYLYAGADPVINVDPSGMDFSIGELMGSLGISEDVDAEDEGATVETKQFADDAIDEIEEIVNPFAEDDSPLGKRMAAEGEVLWTDRLISLGYVAIPLQETVVGSHRPDMVAARLTGGAGSKL